MQTSDIFKKNLDSMKGNVYKKLKEELKNFQELRDFSFTIGKDSLNINLICKKNLKKIYQDPVQELNENLVFYQQNYYNHPFLFFYGLGNGILYKALLKNLNHKRIVIIEK
ncbi:motility associated factor glycosyltransferase family protein, partial [Campylobacter coli]|nr:motility associated factor glycosyltransferase family protein [Campylobacter coli]